MIKTMENRSSPPTRLGQDTILEAVFEVRFSSTQDAAGDLFPGLFKAEFGSRFESVTRLPAADLPRSLLASDKNLIYTPLHVLRGKDELLQVGHQVVTYGAEQPYIGWAKFKPKIEGIIAALRRTGLVNQVERFSLKYVNLIPENLAEPQLQAVNIKIQTGNFRFQENGFMLRMEAEIDAHACIVTVRPKAKFLIVSSSETLSGLLLDIDIICQKPPSNFWDDFSNLIENTHNIEKTIFFDLLAADVLTKLKPEW